MPDYDEKSPYASEFLIPHRTSGPPPFDFERLTRFMSYGFIMAPVQFHWFAFLSRAFPIRKERSTIPALQMVCFDQLIFAPVGLACFFTFMTVTEGGGRRAVVRKFQDVYLPALKANFMIWPAVQILNFRVVPLQFQIVSIALSALGNICLSVCSHLCRQLVLRGQHISLLRTPLTNLYEALRYDFFALYATTWLSKHGFGVLRYVLHN